MTVSDALARFEAWLWGREHLLATVIAIVVTAAVTVPGTWAYRSWTDKEHDFALAVGEEPLNDNETFGYLVTVQISNTGDYTEENLDLSTSIMGVNDEVPLQTTIDRIDASRAIQADRLAGDVSIQYEMGGIYQIVIHRIHPGEGLTVRFLANQPVHVGVKLNTSTRTYSEFLLSPYT